MKIMLAVLLPFMLVSCSNPQVKPGEAYTLYKGLVQLQMDGNTYSCHEISEYNSLSLMCRLNPNRSNK